jgi:hypothetical protein
VAARHEQNTGMSHALSVSRVHNVVQGCPHGGSSVTSPGECGRRRARHLRVRAAGRRRDGVNRPMPNLRAAASPPAS